MKCIFRIGISLVLTVMAAAGCSSQKGELVAKVGDQVITLTDFEADFQSRPQTYSTYDYELEQRRQFLDELIDQKLLVIGAYREGLDKNEEIQRLIEQQQGRFLLDQLYKQEIADRVGVTDEEIRTWYENLGEEIHARHILLETEEDARTVLAELEGGADFASLAQTRSSDPSAAQNAGDLSWFRWGTMVAAFQQAAFALDSGQLSQPVQTDFGWHIIQLLGRRQVDRQPYDQAKAAIEQQIRQQKTQTRLRSFIDEVKGKAELILDQDQLAIVQETYRDTTGPLPFVANLDPALLNTKLQDRPIARFLDTSLTTGDFLRLANQAPPVNRPSFYDTTAIKEFMFQMIYTTVLEREARRLRIDQGEDYKRTLRDFREKLMADKMRSDLTSRPVDLQYEMLQTYYDEHPEEFSSPPQVQVREALVETREEAERIIERVRRGAKFDKICADVTIRPGMRGRRGDLGTFRRFEHPLLFDAAQKMDVGQVGGPIMHTTQSDEQWSVIEVLSKRDAVTRTLDEVEDQIRNKLRNELRQQALSEWLDEMRAETNVQVNEDVLAGSIDISRYPEKG